MPRKRIPTAEKGGVPSLSPSEAFRQGLAADPESAIQRLKSSDMRFWAKVRDAVIVPYLRKSRFGKMAEDRNVPVDEVYDYVYGVMVQDKKLKLLRDKSQLVSYIEQYVRKYVNSFYVLRKKQIQPTPVTPDAWQIWERKHLHDLLLDDAAQDRHEWIAAAVEKVWRQNPKRAYVLVLRIKNNLESKEIKNACGFSSSGNVDQIMKRAKGDMARCLTGGKIK